MGCHVCWIGLLGVTLELENCQVSFPSHPCPPIFSLGAQSSAGQHNSPPSECLLTDLVSSTSLFGATGNPSSIATPWIILPSLLNAEFKTHREKELILNKQVFLHPLEISHSSVQKGMISVRPRFN